ncbi:ankyrin repeat domain-containing protein [Salinisphaera sp. G21_0]|uniref:ankyrin repeat domain-containing protein n=1 Tax=Salinisphaera sp. G21_0 TaxID=2821094 RepID=UPI001AD985A0|nr:ankyrin repeat domain-containing protein [Salinisphaera sp. G21_0]MBO9484590.1 ankyrin repeat domain-containing protein [Salinisphaera sp. G21_0]
MNNVSSRTQPAAVNNPHENPVMVYYDKSVPGVCLVKTRCGHIFEQKNIFASFDGKKLEDRVCGVCNKGPLPLKVIYGRCDDADRYCRNPALEAACTGNISDLLSILTDDPEAVRKYFNDPVRGHEVTLLHAAVDSKQLAIVKLLLMLKADINARIQYLPKSSDITPLLIALENDTEHKKIVDLLVQRGADVNAIMSDSGEMLTEPPLLCAIRMGDIETVQCLMDNGAKVDGNLGNDEVKSLTPLMMAAREGHVDIVEYLLEKGSNANEYGGENNDRTPLMIAALNGHTNIVKMLVEHGADVNAVIRSGEGATALMMAAINGHTNVVKMLVEYGADVNAVLRAGDCEGCTPLMVAAQDGYTNVGKILVEHGADVNVVIRAGDWEGSSILMMAASFADEEFVKFLIDNKANLNAALSGGPSEGCTALWYASSEGKTSIVQTLLEAGADPNPVEKRNDSRTAYMVAKENGHEEVARLLLDHGATDIPPNNLSA